MRSRHAGMRPAAAVHIAPPPLCRCRLLPPADARLSGPLPPAACRACARSAWARCGARACHQGRPTALPAHTPAGAPRLWEHTQRRCQSAAAETACFSSREAAQGCPPHASALAHTSPPLALTLEDVHNHAAGVHAQPLAVRLRVARRGRRRGGAPSDASLRCCTHRLCSCTPSWFPPCHHSPAPLQSPAPRPAPPAPPAP